MNHMRIMAPTLGDEHVQWDPANEASVATAKEKFDAALKEGKLAYTVKSKATKGEQITEFNPELKEIIVAAPLAGG